MLIKQKICAGWDGNSHSAYIYKNIKGKKYCKECTMRLEHPTIIKKVSNKKIRDRVNNNELLQKQKQLFFEIWNERKHSDGYNYCEVTGEKLGLEPLSIYFDHLLEKSKYPQLRFVKENIIIVDGDVHTKKTNGFPLEKHKLLIEKAKELLLG